MDWKNVARKMNTASRLLSNQAFQQGGSVYVWHDLFVFTHHLHKENL